MWRHKSANPRVFTLSIDWSGSSSSTKGTAWCPAAHPSARKYDKAVTFAWELENTRSGSAVTDSAVSRTTGLAMPRER